MGKGDEEKELERESRGAGKEGKVSGGEERKREGMSNPSGTKIQATALPPPVLLYSFVLFGRLIFSR